MGERILVCGGRDFGSLPQVPFDPPYSGYEAAKLLAAKQAAFLKKVLDAAAKKYEIECIIHGAARGADRLAGQWAEAKGITVSAKPANWKRDGNRAGPIRNQQMLDEDKPTLVIAFPGGSGTKDMIQRSKKAGIRVIEVPYG
jgi:hypothetical protein